MSNTILFALVCGVAGVIYAIVTAAWVNKQDAGNQKMMRDFQCGQGRRLCLSGPRV